MTRSEAVTPQILSLDFETFSDVDIGKAGVYRYVESPAFEILLLAYAFNDDDPVVLDFTAMSDDEKEGWKQQFKEWLSDPGIRIHGYNLEFEAAVFSRWFGYNVDLTNWWDTMVTALTCGLPRSLKDVGIALGMPEEEAKLREGKRLVTYFCTPCKPTKANRMHTRNSRETDPEKWSKFVEYNRQDVVAERAIWYKVRNYEPSEKEHIAWIVSTEINRRGVMIDQNMVAQAVRLSELHTVKLIEELKRITGLENPNSNSQLAGWLGMPSVAKANVEEAIQTATGNKRRVLELRKEIGKTSVAKYEAMQNSVCADGRCRGLFAFYGANRTGRYCLAEGTKILIKDRHGLITEKPIEKVSEDDLVYDGNAWVEHEGVVYSGDKEVITWDGITATPNHNVYISDVEKVSLLEAKMRGLRLWRGYCTKSTV